MVQISCFKKAINKVGLTLTNVRIKGEGSAF